MNFWKLAQIPNKSGENEEGESVIKQNIFCYKTLATVTCYDRPDPRRQRVDMNDHNRAR